MPALDAERASAAAGQETAGRRAARVRWRRPAFAISSCGCNGPATAISTCRSRNRSERPPRCQDPQTRGGGVHRHDGYGPDPKNCYEEYVCPFGMPGVYVVRVRRIDGTIVGNRAQLTVVRNQGAKNEIDTDVRAQAERGPCRRADSRAQRAPPRARARASAAINATAEPIAAAVAVADRRIHRGHDRFPGAPCRPSIAPERSRSSSVPAVAGCRRRRRERRGQHLVVA